MKKPKILLLNGFLKTYTGSEIVTLELAESFIALNYDVTVSALEIGYPILNEFRKKNINIRKIANLDEQEEFDIVWGHHFTAVEYCLLYKNITYSKLIYSSLSPTEALECPSILFLEKVSIFLANSEETKRSMINLGIHPNNIKLFPNPAPLSFFQERKKTNKEVKKIAIISNHIPEELLDSKKQLEKKNISVRIIGKGYDEIRVTPDVLLEYDAVITIGKTVQYCLALGIPIYNYDIWGGCGWLITTNINEAAKYNFSGRDYPFKKKSQEISREIIDYYPHNISNFYQKYARKNFNIIKAIKNIINNYDTYNKNTPIIDKFILKHNTFFYQKMYDNFFQIFFEKDNTFTENNSIKHFISDGEYIKLKFTCESTYIRIDLINRPCLIEELKIFLTDEKEQNKKIIDKYLTQDLYKINNKFISISSDPQIIIEIPKEFLYSKINIEYCVKFYELYNTEIHNFINDYNVQIHNKDENIKLLSQNYEQQLHDKDENIKLLSQNYEQQLHDKDKNIKLLSKNYEQQLYDKDENIKLLSQNYGQELYMKEKLLNEIKLSKGYYIMNFYNNILEKKQRILIKLYGFFNSDYYLSHNKDVKDANIDPYYHYMNFGWKEGRNPSKKFNTSFYLDIYPDVKEAQINPLIHYFLYGRNEGRLCIPKEDKITIKDIAILVKNNPALIKKFFVSIKNRGLRSSMIKLKNKIKNNTVTIENMNNNYQIDSILNNYKKENFNKILSFYNKNKFDKFDIIIPIYNGFEFLSPLFSSIVKNTSLPYRLIIGNDCSPDERVISFLNSFIEEHSHIEIIFIDNKENLGFLKTVNRLMKNAQNHVVILNTDTELPPFWLERLMYPILKDPNQVASTTPFTNAGTICSFPEYLQDNKIYKDLNVEELDRFFQYINVEETMISVPTGVGFCMGMNFKTIKEIGFFDEIYGKGYGEENDWCQRAIQAGYINLHITNLFIYHKHGGSFLSEDKIRYINEHYNILLSKFPNYDMDIQKTIKDNKLLPLREFIKFLVDFSTMNNADLIIDHNLGGGANAYREQKIKKNLLLNKPSVLYFYDPLTGKYTIKFIVNEETNFSFITMNHNILFELGNHIKFDKILVNSIVSYPNILSILELIIKLKEKLKAKLVFPIHDYFEICPSYTLINSQDIFCNIPSDLNKCNKCLKNNKNEFQVYCNERDINSWREKWFIFLNHCDEILHFSYSSKDLLLKSYPNINQNILMYQPHDISGRFQLIYLGKEYYNRRVIGILGNINYAKGRGIIEKLVKYIEDNSLEINIVLIGNLDIDIKSNCFIKTGSYTPDTLPSILTKYEISEFFIPSIWPETFSYTTEEIMQLGYPLTVFDIGAPAERVSVYSKGRVISLKTNYLEEICKEWL